MHGLLLVLLSCLVTGPVTGPDAHPHQFVDYTVEIITSESAITGVRVAWYVDEMISAWIIDDFKLAAGTEYTGEEFVKYANEVFYELPKVYYYVIASHDGKAVNPYRWQDTRMTVTADGLLGFSFLLPFPDCPVHPGAKFSFRFEDESYYIDFSLKDDGVRVTGPAAPGNNVSIADDGYCRKITVTW